MKIYIMRHGSTVWNEKGITQGRSRNMLSENGRFLVQELANKYKNIQFDVIFSSPLMRTMQTSNIMNKYHNVKIIKDERLIEIDQGVFTGRSKNDLTEDYNLNGIEVKLDVDISEEIIIEKRGDVTISNQDIQIENEGQRY